MQGIEWESLKESGWRRLAVAERFAPFAEGGFPTPSGKCEFYSESAAKLGLDPLPTYTPPRENVLANPERAKRYPLAFISPPCRNFLNSSFANLRFALASEKEPRLDIHPDDARARGIAEGEQVRVFNDRGSFSVKAAVSTRARPGCVVAPSVWWRKLSPDGRNANDVTSQAIADMGGAATFYDCLVEVAKA
jgi:anaerobic selenocysteine-containing dehydrogenase